VTGDENVVKPPQNACYRCHVRLIQEDDGSFSAVVLNLPGAGSCGDTKEEAVRNVREAILAVIESYNDSHEDIPWRSQDEYGIVDDAKWIIVNA
jgi:predicted RNase H-like HicB family nuclease